MFPPAASGEGPMGVVPGQSIWRATSRPPSPSPCLLHRLGLGMMGGAVPTVPDVHVPRVRRRPTRGILLKEVLDIIPALAAGGSLPCIFMVGTSASRGLVFFQCKCGGGGDDDDDDKRVPAHNLAFPYSKMAAPSSVMHRLLPLLRVRKGDTALSQDATGRRPATHGGAQWPRGKMAARALVQYVVLRGDLRREPLSWPLGATVAQACHAALAVVHAHYQHPDTAAYLAQGGSMRTVVLEAPDECALSALAETLQQNDIDHKVWIEQPENIATCIALRPYPKEHVHHHLKKFKLLK